jgi:hypothetical protein
LTAIEKQVLIKTLAGRRHDGVAEAGCGARLSESLNAPFPEKGPTAKQRAAKPSVRAN